MEELNSNSATTRPSSFTLGQTEVLLGALGLSVSLAAATVPAPFDQFVGPPAWWLVIVVLCVFWRKIPPIKEAPELGVIKGFLPFVIFVFLIYVQVNFYPASRGMTGVVVALALMSPLYLADKKWNFRERLKKHRAKQVAVMLTLFVVVVPVGSLATRSLNHFFARANKKITEQRAATRPVVEAQRP